MSSEERQLTSNQADAVAQLLGAFATRKSRRYLPPEFPPHLVRSPMPEVPSEEELAAAEASNYYWWWAFLRETPEYPPTNKKRGPIAKLYRSFGELGDDFRAWWTSKGRHVFSEPYGPTVRVLYDSAVDGEPVNDDDYDRLQTTQEYLVVVISKHRSREAIREEFKDVLGLYHPRCTLQEG